MPVAGLLDCGWSRDLPDHRDYTRSHAAVRKLLAKAAEAETRDSLPERVDWREYCLPVQDQQQLATSCAHACIGLFQYFERRASGRVISPSRLFLHSNAQRLAGLDGMHGHAGLRMTLKAALKFGLPPERFWPYDPAAIDARPDPYVYGFDAEFRNVRYVRLDAATQSGKQTLAIMKSFLAGGFVCALGFGVPNSIGEDPEIPFPTLFDSIQTGQAVSAVGYDDSLRIRSERGALLIRSSWGTTWGMDGYGWLPYRYITDHLASDVWTLLRSKWLKSGEFLQPA